MKKNWFKIFPFGLLAITVYIGIRNWSCADFWKASAVQLCTPLAAVCLTYFATQMKNDQREAKKHAESLSEKIQRLVADERFLKVENITDPEKQKDFRNQLQIHNRNTNNCIQNLQKYSKLLGFIEEAKYIESEFNRYRELIDTHLNDFTTLSGLEITFKKYSENICTCCDRIIANLYS